MLFTIIYIPEPPKGKFRKNNTYNCHVYYSTVSNFHFYLVLVYLPFFATSLCLSWYIDAVSPGYVKKPDRLNLSAPYTRRPDNARPLLPGPDRPPTVSAAPIHSKPVII